MNIGIIDADLIGAKKHRFPNLASMKISSYNKNLGNNVKLITTWDEEFNQYDDIYLSKVFTATEVPQNVIDLPNIHCGGTGFFYDKAPPLKDEIEHCMPDYHLYDDWISTLVERERERERESNRRFISQQSETKENCKLHNRTSCTGWELDRKAKSQKQWSCQFCKKKKTRHPLCR